MSSEKKSIGEKFAKFVVKTRRQFYKLNPREKILLLLFAFALSGIWLSFQIDRHIAVKDAVKIAHSDASYQRGWLDEEPSIRADFEDLISEINLEELPSKDEIGSQIDAMLRRYRFEFNWPAAKTEEGTNLRFHTMPLEVKSVPFTEIRKFTEEFKTNLPYVSLERILIRPQTRDDSLMDVNFILKAIEPAK